MTQPRLLGGRYELDGVIGRGGMAEVYRARDLRLDRIVAIKTLRTDLARDPTFQARFRREAQSAASLNHPSVVAVYDTGEDEIDGQAVPYIVMEYVEGHTLRELIRPESGAERRLLPERALEITDGILRALDYSHRGGIVHRDIKPANVMLTRAHEVKVMDFGIARAMSDSAATMTATAQVIGTAQYLSPEQARGERVDARSDLYSAGCVLYELLTGRPPFQGDSPVAIAYQHVREEPIPPSQLDPEIPRWADNIVLKAMAKDPAHRYQSASEFRADIQRAMQGMQVSSQSTSTMVVGPPVAAGTQVMGQVPGGATRAQPAASGYGSGYTTDLPPVQYDDTQAGNRRAQQYDRDDQPGMNAQKAGLWVLLAILIIGLFAGMAVWLTNGSGGEDDVKKVSIPAVEGTSGTAAKAALEALKLVVTVEQEPSETIDKGKAIRTDPDVGKEVEEGGKVTLYVSAGKPEPDKVAIPSSIIGKSRQEAIQILSGLGLRLGEVTTKAKADATPDTVLSTKPGVGKQVAKDSAVDLVVAKAVEKFPIPVLDGLDRAGAEAALKAAGFTNYTFIEAAPEGDVEVGKVFKTNPESNKEVTKNTRIVVYIAKGVQPPPTNNPSVPPTPNPSQSGQPGAGGLPLP
ncbi:MAG: Stk1 family PASTA domain-containing Ser/Thr kinase [Streptosporangiaceae bacterium]